MKKRIARLGFSFALFVLLIAVATIGYRHMRAAFDAYQLSTGTISFLGNSDITGPTWENPVPAKDLSFIDMEGNPVKLSDFYGRPIVMTFWASWCESCRDEMPGFENMYARYGDEVTFLMVDFVDGIRETEETAKKFISDNGYSFPIYFDIGKSGKNVYNVPTIPFTVFICADGNIHRIRNGEIREMDFICYVEDVLADQETEQPEE